MLSPGKKFTDLVEIESIQDTDLTVIRNETGVKKTSMQKLSDYIKKKFIGWMFEDLPTEDKTIPGALKELNSALSNLTKIDITSTDNVNSYYVIIGKLVVGFINAKVTSSVITICLTNMPSPYSEGYILKCISSELEEHCLLKFEGDRWNMTLKSGAFKTNTWLRFPITYLTR